jgi:hypothetical protein
MSTQPLRRALGAAAALIAITASAAPAAVLAAATPQYAFLIHGGGMASFMDMTSIRQSGAITSAQTLLVVDAAGVAEKGYASAVLTFEFNCAAHQSRIIYGRVFKADFTVLGEKATPDEPFTPDDVSAADTASYYRVVCDHAAPPGPTFNDLPSAVAWSARF